MIFKEQLRRLKKWLRRKPWKKKYLTRQIGNHVMIIDRYDKGIGKTLLNMKPNDPDREIAFMKIIRKELETGTNVIEIGANIGYVTLIMAEIVGSNGKIYAFEPVLSNYKLLNKNIKLNNYRGIVNTYQQGISNVTKKTKFHTSNKSNLGSITATKHTTNEIEIDLISTDDFMKGKNQINFIKMDIEGHEVEALDGMFNTLKNAKQPIKILMELHQDFYNEDHSLEKQLIRLFDIGFKTKYVISAGVGQPKWFKDHGYDPVEVLYDGFWYRGIYDDLTDEDMLAAACYNHEDFAENVQRPINRIVRAIMIEKSY